MTNGQDAERRIATWLEDGPTVPAEWAVEDAITRANQLPQQRFITTRTRAFPMITAFRLVAAAAVALVVAVGAWRLLPSSPGLGSATPTPVALPATTFSRDVPANGAGAPVGTWTMEIFAGQVWLHGPDGENIGNQISSQTATRIDFYKDLNPDICSFGNTTGSYTWSLTGTTLTLTPAPDPNACRSTILAGTWTGTP
jgi:hypothetical protein